MKVVKINTTLQTNAGFSFPAGAVVVPGQGLISVQDLDRKTGEFKSQIAVNVYASEQAFKDLQNVVNNMVSQFTTTLNVTTTLEQYQQGIAEDLIIGGIFNSLQPIYGENLQIVEIDI